MKFFLLIFTLFLHTISFAGTEGGGGDAVILPDGSVVLADVFLDQDADQPSNRPKKISLNPRLLLQAKFYSEFIYSQLGLINKDKTLFRDVLDPIGKSNSEISYYWVKNADELGGFCAPGFGKIYKVESGEVIQKIACTTGNETYLIGPAFVGLSLTEQALVLIHERLTSLRDENGGRNFKLIGQLVFNLKTLLQIAYEQQHMNYRMLSVNETSAIKDCLDSFIYLAHHYLSESGYFETRWRIHPNGGGMIFYNAEINPLSFVGYHSQIFNSMNLGDRSVIINSSLSDEVNLANDVRVENSTFDRVVLNIGANSKIVNTTILNTTITSGTNLSIEKSEIGKEGGIRWDVVLELNDNAKLKNGKITKESSINYAPAGHNVIFPEILELRGVYEGAGPMITRFPLIDDFHNLEGIVLTATNTYKNSDGIVVSGTIELKEIVEDLDSRFSMVYKGQFTRIGRRITRFIYVDHYDSGTFGALADMARTEFQKMGFKFDGNLMFLQFQE